tara:strand:- start:733 stop:1110 length:378 start_codon:yes stop_codon:yes gene_type:complete
MESAHQTNELKETTECMAAIQAKGDEGFEVAMVTIAGKEYGIRAVTRKEWRILMAERNTKLEAAGDDMKLTVEIQEDEIENLVGKCLVFPAIDVGKMLAGAVDTLSNEILALSGFAGADFEATRL